MNYSIHIINTNVPIAAKEKKKLVDYWGVDNSVLYLPLYVKDQVNSKNEIIKMQEENMNGCVLNPESRMG